MLHNKNVVVAVTGGITAYKTCSVVSQLIKRGAKVRVLMTRNATEFVTPLTFETLSRQRVIVDTFDRDFTWEVEHVSIAESADLFVVVPATANIIAKMAHGIADDFVSTTALAVTCPVLVCPAMNTRMLDAPATQANLATLKERGVALLYGASGMLACGTEGRGRVAEPEDVVDAVCSMLCDKPEPVLDYKGVNVLVTSGGTSEDIDGVRCITNYSSGKMGASIADAFAARGARVTLIKSMSAVVPNDPRVTVRSVRSTQDMYDAVMGLSDLAHVVVMAAAPADYHVATRFESKLHADSLTLELVKNPDIAASVGAGKHDGQTLVIFCAETGDPVESAKRKLAKKNADLVVANDVTLEGAGFNVSTNVVTFVSRNAVEPLPKMSKDAVAQAIADRVAALRSTH